MTAKNFLRIFLFALVLFFSALSGSSAKIQKAPKEVAAPWLVAGYGEHDITPTEALYLPGKPYNRMSSVADNLTVRALYLSDGKTRIVIVALDLIGFFRSDVQHIRERVKDIFPNGENVIVTSTHTHSSPDTLGIWSDARLPGSRTNLYIDRVVSESAEAIREAYADRSASTVSIVRMGLGSLLRNDRDPLLIDDAALFIQFQTRFGPPLTLINFACHPEFLRKSYRVSADFVEPLRGSSRALFINGALGGMIVPHARESGNRVDDAIYFATDILNVFFVIQKHAEEIPVAPLTVRRRLFRVKLDNPQFAHLIAKGRIPVPLKKGKIETEVSVVELGSRLVLVAVPGEISPEISFQIKAMFPKKHVAILGLANDELGYILPKARYREKRYAYEQSLSVSTDIGNKVVHAVRDISK